MKSLTGFKTLVWREIYRFLAVFRQTISPPLISSFLYISIFGLSVGSLIHSVEGVSYVTYLVPGQIMACVIDGAYVNTSSSLFISRWANNIEELLVSPLSYFEMVLAVLIGGLARSLVVGTGVWAISLFFVQFPVEHPLIALYFVIFVSLIFSSIGMMVALYAEEFEHLSVAATFIIMPLTFFGGVFHSINMMPEYLRWVAPINPIYYMISGLRYGMLGFSDAPLVTSMLVVLILFLVLFTSTVLLFKSGYKLRK